MNYKLELIVLLNDRQLYHLAVMFSSKKKRNMRGQSDEELILGFKKESSSLYLEEIYYRYAHIAFGIALHYLKNTQDAEDCIMHFFELLPIKLKKNEITSFKPWMYRVVKNDCFMLLRKRKSVKVEPLRIYEFEEAEQIEDERVEMKLNAILDALSELKNEQRSVLELFYFKKYSYEEIASFMQISTLKVKSAIQNGKRNIKIKLEGNHAFK